jgi:DNA polymerase III alpha subunit
VKNKTSDNYITHLNVQTNSNLGYSLIKIEKLIDFALKEKINILAISDYYPYEFLNFINLCRKNKIKPVIGIKFFLLIEIEKNNNKALENFLCTIYPKNIKGYKQLVKKLFSSNESERNFYEEDLIKYVKENFIVLEARNYREINFFFDRIIAEKNLSSENIFIGFNFFLNTFKIKDEKIISFLIPFFSVSCLEKVELKILEN